MFSQLIAEVISRVVNAMKEKVPSPCGNARAARIGLRRCGPACWRSVCASKCRSTGSCHCREQGVELYPTTCRSSLLYSAGQSAGHFQPNREPTMVKVRYDRNRNTVIVDFEGNVDAEQAKEIFADLERVRPKLEKAFKLLTDFSLVDTMEFSVKREIEKAMDLFNAQGVAEVIRVIPDPNMDIAFNLMSASHYSKQIRVHTLRSRQEAEAHLGNQKTD
jgi:hypothetical protein